jgi:alpha-beta hydrolase superfamily lysophospholipase
MVHLHTSDGVRLSSRRWGPARSAPTTVVLVHGFSASKDHPAVVAVAEAFAERGFGVISYDARGHSESDGLCTLGDLERLDVAAAVDAARQDSDQVVTVGASMGGIAVLRHASTDSELHGAVTVSSPAHWRLPRNPSGLAAATMSRTRLGRSLAERLLNVRIHPVWDDPLPPEAIAADVRSPLAVIHGEADRMIPSSAARRLADAAGGPARLEIVSGMGHAFDSRGTPAIVAAVRWALDQTRETPARSFA